MFVFRVWSVCYNHFHDQLVLSSSSDSRVVLNNIVSLSSEPYGHLLENDDDSDEDKDENRYLTGPPSVVRNVSDYRCSSDCRSRGREFDPGLVPYFRGD